MVRSRVVRFSSFCLFSVFSVCSVVTSSFAASPTLGGIAPRGGSAGPRSLSRSTARRLADAQEVLLYSPGFNVTKLQVVNDNQVQATVKIAPDCRLGEHSMRLRTATGISELRTFWVGALPVAEEKEPNSDFATPQKDPAQRHRSRHRSERGRGLFPRRGEEGPAPDRRDRGHAPGEHAVRPLTSPSSTCKRFELATSDDAPAAGAGCDGVHRRSRRRDLRHSGARERLRRQRRLRISITRRHVPASASGRAGRRQTR